MCKISKRRVGFYINSKDSLKSHPSKLKIFMHFYYNMYVCVCECEETYFTCVRLFISLLSFVCFCKSYFISLLIKISNIQN